MKSAFGRRKTAALVLIAAIVIASVAAAVYVKEKKDRERIAKGVAYLTSLDNQDVKKIRADVLAVEKEQGGQDVSGSSDSKIWKFFGNDVILGDSRAVGFSYYKFLPEDRVLAKSGNTILEIESHLSELQQLNPASVILIYGTNDSLATAWSSPEDYAKKYRSILKKVKKAVPDADIYVCGTLPVTDAAKAKQPGLGNIPKFNQAVKKMCKKAGYGYLDMTKAEGELSSRYEPDGIHVSSSFYPIWARTMKEQMN
ncbi:MAG: GDSL-type esterase/lipase family protein [Eubacteriales bacterium]|nr:GDSL-type esterase/lipase family protein [Eubacteriales bacterium]